MSIRFYGKSNKGIVEYVGIKIARIFMQNFHKNIFFCFFTLVSLNGFAQMKEQLDSTVQFSYNSTNGEWQKEIKDFYFYENSGRVITSIYYQDYIDQEWQAYEKEITTLDDNYKVLTYQSWSNESIDNGMNNSSLTEYLYDGHLTVENFYEIKEGLKTISGKTIHYYDQLDRNNTDTTLYYSSSTGKYELQSSLFRSYNTDNFLIEENYSTYWENNRWEPNSRVNYKRDAAGHMLQQKHYFWNSSLNEWKESNYYQDYFYSEGGNIQEVKSYQKNTSSGMWELSSNYFYYYDLSSLFKDVQIPAEISPVASMFYNKPVLMKGKGFLNTTQSDSVKYELYYSSRLTATTEFPTSNTKISFYPNPTLDVLHLKIPATINYKTFKIVNLFGEVVEKNNLVKKEIDCSGLENGIYYLELIGGSDSQILKFIKM